ncbi:CIC11C00000001797 [Sungouiella intermedia]|uniref:CIC11C00000001797 n=1 Tax=Sungouiella intermedia TaxID=45354 RepID=A0A1L0D4V4_9ASCO|nr:CIC11C00000001797 [[Candida] intermedia]
MPAAMIPERAFVNQFWGPQDGGFAVAQAKIKDSIAMLEELLHYYRERIAIEKDYNKKLEKLNNQVLGSGEIGTLKVALDKLQIESKNMISKHHKFSRSLTLQNYEKLHNFYQIYVKNTTKLETHMQKVISRKHDCFNRLETAKEKFRMESSQVKSLTLLCQTTWGKELDRNTMKLNKLRMELEGSRRVYQATLKRYNDIHEIWVRDWAIALLNLYQLEIERIQMCKLNCFSYCNNIALLCVDLDQCADVARNSFAKVAAPNDIHDFAITYGSGDKIPNAPVFIDFLNGMDEDCLEKPPYTVANFKDPDFSQILTRTFSVQSDMAGGQRQSPTRLNVSPQADSTHISNAMLTGSPQQRTPTSKQLPPIKEPLLSKLPPKFDLNNEMSPSKLLAQSVQLGPPAGLSGIFSRLADRSGPEQGNNMIGIRKTPSRTSAYTSGAEDRADLFDEGNKLQSSNGLLEYSNPTNYTSNTARSWSSPRRKDKLVHDVQDQINRRLRDMTDLFSSMASHGPPPMQKPDVPIAKDFSIDFMAKALEDLNAGGDGDVTQFRRSVRDASGMLGASTSTIMQKLPPSDFVDDEDEIATRRDETRSTIGLRSGIALSGERRDNIATRNDSIAFRSPRPKSMVVEGLNFQEENLSDTIVRKDMRRLLLRSPTKSYTNLNSFVEKITPVTRHKFETKAVAKYTYNAQEKGELGFRKGWHMYVIHKQEDNWYVCELGENCGSSRGNVGLVPYNYLVEGDGVF